MSACVLPIAPEFQDPPASQNYPPFFVVETDPEIGSVVKTPSFSVTVSDPNVGDDLFVRWIADYPPATGNTRVLLNFTSPRSTNGLPQVRVSSVEPDCNLNTLAKLPSHRIMVIVADRPFDQTGPAAGDFGRIPEDGRKVVASWTLDMECK